MLKITKLLKILTFKTKNNNIKLLNLILKLLKN